MQVGLTIDLPVDDDERDQLAAILACEPEELDEALQPVAQAAVEEYVRMFLGQKVFTRGGDILEYRLFLLIRRFFGRQIPGHQRISDLFQVPASRSRTLLKNVMSKYQYDLKSAVDDTLRDLLTTAEQDESEAYHVVISADNLVDALNGHLASLEGTLPPVSKKRGTVSTYKIQPSAYQALCEELGVDADDGE